MINKHELIHRLDMMFKSIDMYDACEDNIDDIIYKLPNASVTNLYTWENGASKLVLFFNDLPNYVVKLPIHTSGEINEEDYEDNNQYLLYSGADNDLDRSDYCQTEVELYEAAEEYGVEQFFAKTEYLYTNKLGERVYLQERCSSDDFRDIECIDPIGSSQAIENSCGYRTKNINGHWLILAYEYYGEEQFIKFMDFLYTKNINDIHDGNIGMIDDRPVIFDYSGFND